MIVCSSCLGRMIFLLCESLDAGDASQAWLVWSRAAEAAPADAYRFSGGPAPCQGLVLGRGMARFRLVRLGGHHVRKVRSNTVDVHDAADVFLYRDSSIAPLLDMRRKFRAVMDILEAMIGVVSILPCLLNSLLNGAGLLALCILLLLMIFMRFRAWVLVTSIVLFLVFIIDLVILFIQLWFTVGMRLLGSGVIGCGRIPWFILTSGSDPI